MCTEREIRAHTHQPADAGHKINIFEKGENVTYIFSSILNVRSVPFFFISLTYLFYAIIGQGCGGGHRYYGGKERKSRKKKTHTQHSTEG